MNISIKWLKEYLDFDLSVEELKDKLTFSGIEVEAVHKTGELLKQIVVGHIVSKEKHPEADKLSVCMVVTSASSLQSGDKDITATGDGEASSLQSGDKDITATGNGGASSLQVVCGAPNCAAGQKIAFAPVGTDFGDFKIKKAKLRGVESNGMICSEAEMGISDNHDGIMVLPDDAPIGQSLADYLKLSDTIFEVEITPNRPDLLGMIGIARDLSAQLDIPLKYPVSKNQCPELTGESSVPLSGHFHTGHSLDTGHWTQDTLSIENTVPDLCPRYTAVKISGVKVAPSPQWLIEKLKVADIKPINNIVDITNLVMYEYGHPLHAFDAKYVAGDKIVIRKSQKGEVFPALDNQTYTLTGEELVIADTEKPIALAGVIGGKNSHITDETTDIILEAACFDTSITRRTSYNLKIFTDSAYRFERGMAPQTCEIISARATQLILELASITNTTIASPLYDSYPHPQPLKVIALRPARVKHLLSLTLDNHKIISYLKNLGCKFLKADADSLYFEIPPVRVDLEREIDLIEEIIRLHGFDKVAEIPQPANVMNSDIFYTRRNIKNLLVQNGFFEAVNLSFTDPAMLDLLRLPDDDPRRAVVKIINPQGASFSILRSTLLPQLLKNVLTNLNHGDENIALFELNKVFLGIRDKDLGVRYNDGFASEKYRLTAVLTGKASPTYWKEKPQNIDFYDIKGIVETIVASILRIDTMQLKPTTEPYYLPHSGFDIVVSNVSDQLSAVIGSLGRLDTKVLKDFDIEAEVFAFDLDLDTLFTHADFSTPKFTELPKYPIVRRDLSFVVSEQHQMSDIIKTINEVNPKLIQSVIPFDQYKGKNITDGYRSLSISIYLNSQQKTMTDEQIKTIVTKIVEKLTAKFQIEMR